MEFVCLAAVAVLAAVCLRQGRRLRRMERALAAQGRAVAAAEERLEEQSLRQEDAVRAERMFREGLQNILNYGVM